MPTPTKADRCGAHGTDGGFSDVCFFEAVQACGVHVAPTRNGPVWADAEGNEFLMPSGHCLVPTPSAALRGAGRFVLHTPHAGGHFYAVLTTPSAMNKVDKGVRSDMRPSEIEATICNAAIQVYRFQAVTRGVAYPRVASADRLGGATGSIWLGSTVLPPHPTCYRHQG